MGSEEQPGPADPNPESVPSEGDLEKELPRVPDEVEEGDGNGEPPPESIPGDSGEVPNPRQA